MREPAKSDQKRAPGTLLRTATFSVAAAASGTGLVLLVLAWGHWWPSGTEWYLTAGIGILLLMFAGLAWLVGAIVVLVRRRRFAWWMLAWPLVTVAGLALVLLVRPEFEDARPEFEEVAQELLTAPGPPALYNFKIGRFEISSAYAFSDGTVYFVDLRTGMFTTERGWLYAPGGVPDRDGRMTTVHLSGPWYRYTLLSTF
ncbi:hypothetical protein IEU95_02890 [Hoyosella rhizosphaerae]|uniref:DUF1109 domain-containing protein n=1 Tax=Hoyosella rhizosphaerae TaxID=1755582 RepID=A0A916UEL8_9ACTN|nr:hypothetical protein [Hoyosella rhizosphaerae]MBN4925762.1 hypothetical protein [Hoyosella rhizosphaerae]GGC68162.1 hypothetical protein GCM10011410_21110 [Hoyosella rhizosphaerae]